MTQQKSTRTERTPRMALESLISGNQAFIANELPGGLRAEEWLQLAEKQEPYAAILGCSDSRVPHETIFNKGPGEIFSVRNAGGIPGIQALESLEFAVEDLKVPLIMVLGHENCGAVTKAVREQATGGERGSGNIVTALMPAVQAARRPAQSQSDHVHAAIEAHIERTVAKIRARETLAAAIAAGRLQVVGAIFEFRARLVRLMPPGL